MHTRVEDLVAPGCLPRKACSTRTDRACGVLVDIVHSGVAHEARAQECMARGGPGMLTRMHIVFCCLDLLQHAML